ncbi:hypothetical protein [Mesorhizobium sp. LjNodule214]|uniref:hypothetical protein n=1 Tax=Mesorhizobium sp. LjNodule214 TaxID=3342252 RepID=UPI003ED1155B
MANIRSPSCECTTAFVSIFDGRKFVKGALGARITKVGQTNIDKLLVDFFCRHVKFLVLVTAAARSSVGRNPKSRPKRRLKKNRKKVGTILALTHFDRVSNS